MPFDLFGSSLNPEQKGNRRPRHVQRGGASGSKSAVWVLTLLVLAALTGGMRVLRFEPRPVANSPAAQPAMTATTPNLTTTSSQAAPKDKDINPDGRQTVNAGPLRIEIGKVPTSQIHADGKVAPSAALTLAKNTDLKNGFSTNLNFGNFPMSFEANAGQADPAVRYQANGRGYKLALESSGATLSLAVPDHNGSLDKVEQTDSRLPRIPRAQVRYSDLHLEFVGANRAPQVDGREMLPGKSNYFLSSDPRSWHTNIPTYSRVHYKDLYPGVDLVYYGNQRQLEYDFVVSAGADPNAIALQLLGSRNEKLARDGSLVVGIDGGEVRFQKPLVYQKNERGEREYVDGDYVLEAHNLASGIPAKVRFRIGAYDRRRELIIDPVILYSIFPGGFSGVIASLATDSAGYAYVLSGNGYSNQTVTKITPDGSTVVYTTVLGTSGVVDAPQSIAVDASGTVYLTGYGTSNYPTTPSAFQQTFSSGYYQPFVTVLNSTGASLNYSSFLAATTSYSYGYGVAYDGSGNVYITGATEASDFPTTTGAFQTTRTSTGWALFVAKFNPSASGAASLVYSTLINGTNNSYGYAIAADSSGSAYITGNMDGGYPQTSGALNFDGENAANGGVFVTKLNATGSALVYSAFLGSGTGVGIAVDGAGFAYVTGNPGASDFPTTAGAYQTNDPGGFASKLATNGSAFVWSTFLSGPSLLTTVQSLAIPPSCASNCNVYIGGFTSATDFPVVNAVQNFNAGGASDDFFLELSSDGSTALVSSFLGGSSTDGNVSSAQFDPHIAVDGSGNILLGGGTYSTDFPITGAGTFSDTFLAKISPTNAPLGIAIPSSINFNSEGVNIAATSQTILVRNAGSAAMTVSSIVASGDFAQTNNCGSSIAGGGTCTITVTFTPTISGVRFGTVTITDSASNSPTVVNLQGNGVDGATLNFSPTILNFGAQAVGSTSTPQTTTISNIGDQTLTIYSVYMSPSTPNFSQTNNCPSTLAPGGSCTVTVVFTPTQPGYLSNTLTESDSGNSYGHYPVTLTGTGTVSTDAAITPSATALGFPAQAVGTTSAYEYVIFTSTGSTPATISSVTVTGDYILSNGCNLNYNYQPGGGCYVYIYFKPTAAGTRTGTLTVTDDTSASPHVISLTGIGLAQTQTVTVTPTTLVFPNQLVGTTSPVQYVYIYNTGTAPVQFDRVQDTFTFPTYNNNCNTIAPNSSCFISVYYMPTTVGTQSATLTLVDSATGSPQTISVSGTSYGGTTALTSTSTNMNFGSWVVNTTSGVLTVYIYNQGTLGVTFSNVTASGDFAIQSNGCTGTLPGGLDSSQNGNLDGSDCAINVEFTPTATGARTGSLTITSSAATQVISLNGTGVAATGSIAPTVTSLAFGPQVVNTTSGIQTVYVYNTGTASVTFGTLSISAGFTLEYDGCSGATLTGSLIDQNGNLSNNDCQLNIEFAPTATGNTTGTITIPSSDPTQTISLSGTGVATTASLTPTITGLTFGPQPVNTTSTAQTFYVYNEGDVPVNLGTVTASSGFTVSYDSCSGVTLNGSILTSQDGEVSGSYCQLNVTFTPTTTGVISGTISIPSTDPTQTVNLSGTGIAATQTLLFIPTASDFGSVVAGTTTSYQQIYVYNSGSEVVTFSAAPTTSSPFAIYSDGCGGNGSTVQPGASCIEYVTYTAAGSGLQTGSLNFSSNATNTPQSVTLTGTSVSAAPGVSFSPATLGFLPQAVGTSSSVGNITATFNAAATVTSVTGSGDFAVTSNSCGSSVGTGGVCSYGITFTPTAAGSRTGTLTVTEQGGATFKANLAGFAFTPTSTLIASPTGIDFPNQPQGTTYSYLVATITNTGNVPVAGINDAISGTNSGDFTFYINGCAGTSLNPGTACSVYLSFTPSGTGARSATLSITSSNAATVAVSLTGTGDAASASLSAAPSSMQFPSQPQGSTYQYLYSTITNNGNVAVTGINAAISGTNAGDFPFYINSCSGVSLNPGNTCSVYVNFTPTGTGSRSATLTVTSTNAPTVTMPLAGTGVTATPSLVAEPPSLVFPNEPLGTTYTYLLTYIVNTGNVPVTGINDAISGTNAADFPFYSNGCTSSTTINPGNYCLVYMNFTPSATGTRTATLTITSANASTVTVALSGTGVPASPGLAASPTVVVFPDTPQGIPYSYLTTGISNTGNVPVTAIGATISGTNAADYSFYINSCGTGGTTLNPANGCTLYLTFTPSGTGTRTATVTVTSANASPVTIALSGKGLTPSPTAMVTPTSLNAPVETVNTTYINAGTVAFYATGNQPINISSVNITGNFSINSNQCPATVQPGGSCLIYINFTPLSAGSQTGTLTVTDSSNTSPHTVSLTGVGITNAQAIQLSQTSVAFGNQPIGFASNPAYVYYYNQGPTNVSVTGLSVTTGASDYSISGSSCGVGTAQSTGSCYIQIVFTPTATGSRPGAITITDSAVGSPRTITLSGTGVNPFPIVSLTPGTLSFPSQNVGTTSNSQAITLTNTGTAALTFSAPTASGDFSVSQNFCTSPLASKGTCSFYVSFSPTATGTRPGTFTLTSNASTSPDHVSLTGTGVGVGPVAVISPGSIDFANQTVNTTSTSQTVTLSNTGNGAMTISAISTSGDFAQTNNCPLSPSTLAANSSCQISVTFTPTQAGNRQGLLSVTDNAAGSPQHINLAGMGTAAAPAVTLNPTSLVFSNQTISVQSAPQNVTLTNSGAGTLNIGSIVATGDFQQTNNCGSTLAAGNACNISVTFTPTAAGTRNGTLVFNDNAANSPQSVSLSGTGIVGPLVGLSPQSLTFGSVNVGTSAPTQTVTVTNTGTATLGLTSISVSFDPTDFSQTNNCPASLGISASCTITVKFTPSTFGFLSGTISIVDNAYNTPQTIQVTGTGVGSGVFFNPGSLTFATQNVGTTSAAQTVTLTNNGNATLTGISISINGDYAQTNTCGTSLASGLNCSISVTFTPTATGTRNGTLSVADNAAGSPQMVSLTGNGTGAIISLSPTSLSFGSLAVGSTSAAQTITVTNTGNTNLTFSNIQTSLSDFAFTNNCPANITPNTPCTISVTFTPATTGARNGNLILTDNTSTSPQSLALSGTGTGVPAVSLSPGSLSFPGQVVGTTSASQAITLTNSGTATLNIGTITISGDFNDTNNCAGVALGIGGSCTISVTFTPSALGTRTGTLTINDNAGNTPQMASLSGTGTGVPGISFNPGSLSFPGQAVGTTSAAQTVTITNNGSAVLAITAIAASGDFGQTNNCPISPSTLGVGASCTASVTFHPTATGTRSGALSVTDNANGSPQSVSLTGTGTSTNSTTVVASSLNPSVYGQTVTFTTTVSGAGPTPTGTVSLTDNGTAITGCTSLPLSSGQASCVDTALVAGSHTILATYSGDTNYGASSGSLTQTVTKGSSSTAVTSSANPSTVNGAVTFTATVTPVAPSTVTPTGTVTFTSNGNPIAACSGVAINGSGVAVCATSALPAGSQTILATYSGSTNYNASSGSLTQTVNKASTSTTLVSATNPSTVDQSVTFTGTVAPANGAVPPTGTLSFTDNGNPITGCTSLAITGGVATCADSAMTAGSHTIVVTYSGDANFNGSTSASLTQTVNKASSTTAVTGSPNPSTSGQSVTFTATLTAPNSPLAPSGTVTFTSNGIAITGCTGATVTSGTATCTTSTLTTGSYTIVATFSGDANFLGSTGQTTQTVTAATLKSIAIAPASASIAKGQTQQFTATGTYSDGSTQNITSSVTWTSGTATVATISSAGLTTGVGTGTSNITASLSGVTSNTAVLTVTAATLQSIAVAPTAASIAKGQTQQFTATGTYSDGSTQNITSTVIWTSGTATVATISSAGLATGVGTGTSNITASLSGVTSNTAVLTVTAATLQSIAVAPAAASIAKGQTQQLTATGTYSDGSTQNITSTVTWASGTASVATISASGLASGVGTGTSNITASLSGVTSNTATLTVTAATLQSIAVAPSAASIAKGQTQQFTATGTYSDGSTQNLTSSVTWASGTASVATISASGLASGVGTGTSNITASLSGVTSNIATLTVTAATLQSIAVAPSAASIAKGQTQQFTATGTYSDGSTQNITSSVTWASGTASVATISASGLASGVGTGTSNITASLSGVTSNTATLTVTAATLQSIAVAPSAASIAKGQTQQFTATGTYSDGSTQNLTSTVTWTSGTATVATISSAGLATGVGTGTSNITASLSGVTSNTAVVTVTAATLKSIAVTPASASIAKGQTQQFTATGTYSDGSTQNITSTVTWTSATSSVATISASGLASGVGTGTSNITASLSGVTSNTATLTVTAATLQSIAVAPSAASIAKGQTQQFTATGTYSDGSTQNITSTVTWTSGTASVATISASGLASGVGTGTSNVTASLSGVTSNTAVLTVTAATLQSIAVAPTAASIAKGQTQQFTATGTYSDGSTQNITSTVTWTSGTATVATISSAGLASGVGTGTSNITASLSGVTSNTAVLTVTAATLQSIAVAPSAASIAKGQTQQFNATGTYSDGSTQNLTSSVTWASGTASVATISASGLATGVGTGTSNITASLSGVTSNTATLTVTAATLQSIAVAPTAASIAKGATQQFTATGTYSDGSTQNLTSTVTWTSATSSVATIGASGLASGVGTGTSNITASLSGVTSNTATLTVTAATLKSIAVTPASASIAKGATQQFTATGTYSDGSTQNITSSVTWASGTASVATISASGLASGVGTGASNITASLSGVTSNTAVLTVTAATLQSIAVAPSAASIAKGATQQFTATGTYSDGSTQNLTSQVTWTSGTATVATITSTGLASGVGTGTSNITASLSGVTSNTAVLTVTAATLQSIAVAPSAASITKGATQQFTATGTYSDGSTQNITSTVTWTSGTTTVATISASGLATGVGTGASNITASLSGVTSNTAVLTVTAATLQSIAVAPSAASITKGATQQFTATGTYSDGSTQNLTSTVTWTSGTASVATISASGLASGVGTGTSNITASLSGVTSNTAVLTVTTPALAITTASLPNGQVGVAYPTTTLAATGGVTPYSWTITGLPGGLTPTTSGVISGTPAASGTFTVNVTVTDSTGATASRSYSMTISPASSGEPAISIKLLDQGTNASGNFYVDLQVTNTGTGNASSASINSVAFRVLTGTGTVTYNSSLSPSLPIAIGSLNAGISTTVRVYLTVSSTVTRFTITENGNVVDMSGTSLAYSASQSVVY